MLLSYTEKWQCIVSGDREGLGSSDISCFHFHAKWQPYGIYLHITIKYWVEKQYSVLLWSGWEASNHLELTAHTHLL